MKRSLFAPFFVPSLKKKNKAFCYKTFNLPPKEIFTDEKDRF